jgi:hypothetical protein
MLLEYRLFKRKERERRRSRKKERNEKDKGETDGSVEEHGGV